MADKDILLRTEGTFHPYMHYSHVSFVIPVEKCYENIWIDLEYDPLFLEENNDEELKAMMREALKTQIMRTDEAYVEEVMTKCMPLKNQISIAAKGPEGWRGEHHFFPGKQTVTLNGKNSTDGFINVENKEGIYEIVLHVFGVYNDVSYKLKVSGGNE